jgi:hypothetical protein
MMNFSLFEGSPAGLWLSIQYLGTLLAHEACVVIETHTRCNLETAGELGCHSHDVFSTASYLPLEMPDTCGVSNPRVMIHQAADHRVG